jgi:hypothetical protein
MPKKDALVLFVPLGVLGVLAVQFFNASVTTRGRAVSFQRRVYHTE